jgi:hypothetical protein
VSDIDDRLKERIDDATQRVLNGREDIQPGIYMFLLDALPDRNLEEALDPEEAIEMPLRRSAGHSVVGSASARGEPGLSRRAR